MTRLDWEKANQRQRNWGDPPDNSRQRRAVIRRNARKQEAMAQFVVAHRIACFKCKAPIAEWAKTGISKRGAWAICSACVKRPAE